MDVPGAPQPARFVCQNPKTVLQTGRYASKTSRLHQESLRQLHFEATVTLFERAGRKIPARRRGADAPRGARRAERAARSAGPTKSPGPPPPPRRRAGGRDTTSAPPPVTQPSLRGKCQEAGVFERVFRSPGVGAVMFALLPTLWVFVPTLFFVRREVNRCLLCDA